MTFNARLFFLTAILGVVVLLSAATSTPSRSSHESDSIKDAAYVTQGGLQASDDIQSELTTPPVQEKRTRNLSGRLAIRSVDIPFLQTKDDWEREGKGISFDFSGEPRSGTTWIGRVMVHLAIDLCGSPTNQWCEMGGLEMTSDISGASYEFEMIDANTRKLFMHFRGTIKHSIPGFDVKHDCNLNGRAHWYWFDGQSPCSGRVGGRTTRKTLTRCLPVTSPRCAQYLPSRDPTVRRIAVIFRDPRNVVISEHRVLSQLHEPRTTGGLDWFIHNRLEAIVSWMHQRWVWHTTFLSSVSHVMFYEDLQDDHIHISSLAEFMGLKCSPEQAQIVWEANRYESPYGGYNSRGLPIKTIEWMNVTMARLLPEPMLARWGLTPIFTDDPSVRPVERHFSTKCEDMGALEHELAISPREVTLCCVTRRSCCLISARNWCTSCPDLSVCVMMLCSSSKNSC